MSAQPRSQPLPPAARRPDRASLRDRWRALRDRLLSDPRFLRRASALPIARTLARRETRALFDLVAGFTYSQVLYACVRLDLFGLLAREGPLETATLARRIGLPEDRAGRLVAAAVSLRLLETHDDRRIGLGPLGAPIVAQPAIAAMIEHHATLYRDLADPVPLLRGERECTALADYWPYARAGGDPAALPPERVAEYSALMSASQPLVAEQVLDAYPLHRHGCLLDVGGGEGVFVSAVAARDAQPRLMLFDLPAVAERARARLGARGLAARVQVHGGSFFDDPLPSGADVVSLVRVLFDHPDERVLALLRAVRAALPEGGTVLVAEPMAGTAGAGAIGAAYYAMYLLAMGGGRARTPGQIGDLLRGAGFDRIREVPTRLPVQARVVIARAAPR